tara:strand:+ start:946 stop:1452 length:507 start_codon:yes stop_codon:yes gene_type:complete
VFARRGSVGNLAEGIAKGFVPARAQPPAQSVVGRLDRVRKRSGGKKKSACLNRPEANVKTAIVINRDSMGQGDPQLGKKILGTFLTKAGAAFRDLEAVVFYNSGVRCLAEGSAYLPQLATLDEQGVDLIACGTCVDAFELRDQIRVGEVGSMDRILSELDQAAKVITI